MKYKILDMVLLNKEIHHQASLYGRMGTIVEIYTHPNLAYEIEFCDNNGKTIGIITLSESEMDNYLVIKQ